MCQKLKKKRRKEREKETFLIIKSHVVGERDIRVLTFRLKTLWTNGFFLLKIPKSRPVEWVDRQIKIINKGGHPEERIIKQEKWYFKKVKKLREWRMGTIGVNRTKPKCIQKIRSVYFQWDCFFQGYTKRFYEKSSKLSFVFVIFEAVFKVILNLCFSGWRFGIR